MSFSQNLKHWQKRLRLDSHHTIERFGVLVGIFSILGLLVVSLTGIRAYEADANRMTDQAIYTSTFTTSKSQLPGDVKGVYTNTAGTRALVMMSFESTAAISYAAKDYQAFLLGMTTDSSGVASEPVTTPGVRGSFYVFGSTGYVGVVLDAAQPFDTQILNLTMRANTVLSVEDPAAQKADVLGDDTFRRFDQWRVLINPGAKGATKIPALNGATFDAAQAYYDIVLAPREQIARAALDKNLRAMNVDLKQIASYSNDLATTKVDGLFLKPPATPALMVGDKVTVDTAKAPGASANADATATATADTATNGATSTSSIATNVDDTPLTLVTKHVVPSGFDFTWRSRTVFDGYLNQVVPAGVGFVEYLSAKNKEVGDSLSQEVASMPWVLSDGTDLKSGYQVSDVTMKPLVTVMNNLSRAYASYAKNKTDYQIKLLGNLLNLDVELRNVQTNGSTNTTAKFLTVYTP